MDWTPIDYDPRERLDLERCVCGYDALAPVDEVVKRICTVSRNVEPAYTMYREQDGKWYRTREPATWFEMRRFAKGS